MTIIRDGEESDFPALLELYTHLHESDTPREEGDLRAVWDDMLRDPKLHCLVAELDGRLVASCILVVVPNLTRGGRPFGVIENVVTHREYRRRGIGSRLLRHALNLAWESGCYKVMLQSGMHRVDSHPFYESVGFKKGAKVGFEARPGRDS